jgi:CorA-like Mg2+ transporter protein
MEVSAAEPVAMTAPDSVRFSAWPAGGAPRLVKPGDALGDGEILWCELLAGLNAGEASAALTSHCPGLTSEMLEELLTPDLLPEGHDYVGGSIRLASMCALRYEPAIAAWAPDDTAIAIQPVELLASHTWLVTNWHEPRRVTSDGENASGVEIVDPTVCRSAMERRWRSGNGHTAGDLGLLLMHELALTFAPTARDLSSVLEDWELRLYDGESTTDQLLAQRDALRRLWQLRAVMRDWVAPLNRPGMSFDIDKVWLPCADHAEAKAIDDRTDRVLENLAKLGEALRASFHLIHLEEVERERERREQMQRRVELIAAIFLIPTFIFGLYGANTWLPGQGREWGFAVMLAVMGVFTLSGVLLINRWHGQRAADHDGQEQRLLR